MNNIVIVALILRQQGNIEESLTTFQAALVLNPSNVNNLKQVGRSLYLLGRHRTALSIFEEAEALASEDREVWYSKGMCHMYLKQLHVAIECFNTANSIQRNEETSMQLGKVYRQLGNDNEALMVYMEALESCPESPELLTTIGLLYLKMGNSTKSFEFLGNSLTYDPKSSKAILAAGSIIQESQDMDVALVKYRVASLETPNSAQLWNNIGMCFFGKGKYVAAVSCLKRANYFAPFEYIVSFNLGVVHLTTGQYASAFHYFSTTINLQPTYSKAYMYLAIALSKYRLFTQVTPAILLILLCLRLEDFDNSCAAYEKSLELSPSDYTTHLNYAITLFLNDERERALDQYLKHEKALEDVNLDDVDHVIIEQARLLQQQLVH
jgi:Bardet-Biedl syndrome 4 protein